MPSQDDLASQLGVSRIVVREAVLQLSSMGYLTIKQGLGTYVNDYNCNKLIKKTISNSLISITEEDLKNILETRDMIEERTVVLAIERANENQLNRLKEIYEEMIINKSNPENFMTKDYEFHLQIARASNNSLLYTLLDTIRQSYWNELLKILKFPMIIDSAIRYHEKILDSIISQDKENAKKYMHHHLINPLEPNFYIADDFELFNDI